MVLELNLKNFDSTVKKGNSVIDFWAAWCSPCKYLSPIVEELSKEMKDIKFAKVDVDKQNELAQRFEVMSIPTLLFFKDGEQVERVTGAMSKDELQELIEQTF
ncbi:thioredoxin [Candidatus Pacearchaeota archaeon]|nr:thioredoxin [Candidatus Pacearchaeota archaeon]